MSKSYLLIMTLMALNLACSNAPVPSYCLYGWTETAEGASKVIQLNVIEQERYVKLLPEDRAYICAHSIGSSTYIISSEGSELFSTRFTNMIKIEEEVILAK